jgi:two-component system, OmpR family, sensor histidine kinase BaeS
MTLSLRARLTLSHVLVAALCILMVSALANGVLESSFRSYVQQNQAHQAQAIVAQLGVQYAGGLAAAGHWNEAGITAIGMSALEQGLIVKVADAQGAMVWDATVHNNGLCVQMITHMAQNMASRYPNWRGSYTEQSFPMHSNLLPVGTVTIGYYGPFFLNDQELAFINSLNTLLLWVTAAAMILALVIGFVSARRVTGPLARVAEATTRMAGGDRNVLLRETTHIRELDGIASSVNDLSRALRDQEDLRRRLTADMTHELRTPLATLQSHLEALIDGVWQPDAARLAGLHEEILRLNRLVADLEKLAHVEGEAADLHRGLVSISNLVAGIVRNHEPQFREKGVSLSFASMTRDGTEDGSGLAVDPDKLSQAVINLLSNALKYTPSGGSVRVEVDTRSSSATLIRVADTGIGIGPQNLPRVFERLYRVDDSRSRATGGAGIGLSIAKAIVEAHGGTIQASSEPGAGTELLITLPVSLSEPRYPSAKQSD